MQAGAICYPAGMIRALPFPVRLAGHLALTAALLWLCLAPQRDLEGLPHFWDKAEHAAAFGVYALAGMLLFPSRPVGMAAFALALGAVIEVAQARMGLGRHGDWADWIGDLVGVAGAVAIDAWLRRRTDA